MNNNNPYRIQPNIFADKLNIAKKKLAEKKEDDERLRKHYLEEREKIELENKKKELKELAILAEINEVIYPLMLKISSGLAWNKFNNRLIDYNNCVALYSQNKKYYPQYICCRVEMFSALPVIVESASFAEMVEDLSNPKLKRNINLYGPSPRIIIFIKICYLLAIICFLILLAFVCTLGSCPGVP